MNMYDNYEDGTSAYNTVNYHQHHHHQTSGPGIPMYHPIPGQLPHIPSPTLSDILPLSPTVPIPPSYTPPTHYIPQYSHAGISHEAAIPVDTRRGIPQAPENHFNEVPVPGPSRRQPSRRTEAHPYMSSSSNYPKRRPHSHLQVQSSDDEELGDLPPNATDQQKIEHQRHRNTLAARRSRKRKEVYRQELEQLVDQLTMETEKWKTRAEMLRRIIEGQGMGLICPDWSE
ncbi:hypothetical protein V5O48_014146 [Marasmius crinis-equi]|uniref:BZIP domain-containing protein n=1 Tax=Marasmius crinis-equi TaxID=585013 RepID=A0ABR3EY46_9AGAR